MDFINEMNKTSTWDVEFNGQTTENGAVGFATTGKALLDLNFAVASLRSADEEEIIGRFDDAFNENPELAMLWLFYARDIREGLGERRLFKVCARRLYSAGVLTVDSVSPFIELIGLYGRYDDVYALVGLDEDLDQEIADCLSAQLATDVSNMNDGGSVSLLAKWMKSEKDSSAESKALYWWFINHSNFTPRSYRKTISALRRYSNVTEVKLCANEWDNVDYSKVPSKAMLKYKEAFGRHDGERYDEFISKVNKGEAKINAGTLYPHDIVHDYCKQYNYCYGGLKFKTDDSLEALWKNLPNTFDPTKSTLVVADGSGSMASPIGKTSTSALEVANALAIYFSERNSGEFKDKYITFSEHPKFVDFSRYDTLADKLTEAYKHNEVANTNIEAVFDLILKTAVRNNCSQEEIPANILIISDMEFDMATDGRIDRSLFEEIAEKYEAAGYKLPRLVFWNVNSRSMAIPVTQNENGIALVSGFSVNIAKMVMSAELDPYKCLIEVLESDRYTFVEEFIEANM